MPTWTKKGKFIIKSIENLMVEIKKLCLALFPKIKEKDVDIILDMKVNEQSTIRFDV